MQEREYWLALQMLFAGQPRKIRKIRETYRQPADFWSASVADLQELFPSARTEAGVLLRKRDQVDPFAEMERLQRLGADFICYDDAKYPENLKNIFDPPAVLYIMGDAEVLQPAALAVVGSRKATALGCRITEKFAGELAAAGILVVSGMARGIDSAAHRGALTAGKTAAVLGCGLNVCYPPENKKLLSGIVEKGVVLSEFPLDSQPESWHFPQRNRIISGLSLGVLVVEATLKSGAMITASMALEQGREVFAVPGSINNQLAKGPNQLIKDGACLTEQVDDILNVLICGDRRSREQAIDLLTGKAETKLHSNTRLPNKETAMPAAVLNALTSQEKIIMQLLQAGTVNIDDLVQQSDLNVQEVNSSLLYLELKGLILSLPGNNYVINI